TDGARPAGRGAPEKRGGRSTFILPGMGQAVEKGQGVRGFGATYEMAPASRRARQTLSEVNGIPMFVMPNGARASRTALVMAGGALTQPDSPTPFAPIGLYGDVVTVMSSSKF